MSRIIMTKLSALLLCSLIAVAEAGCFERTVIEEQQPVAVTTTDGDPSTDDPGTDNSGGLHGARGQLHAITTESCNDCGPLPNPWTAGPLPNPWDQSSSGSNGNGTPNNGNGNGTDPIPPHTSSSSSSGGTGTGHKD